MQIVAVSESGADRLSPMFNPVSSSGTNSVDIIDGDLRRGQRRFVTSANLVTDSDIATSIDSLTPLLSGRNWIQHELGDAQLGDTRRTWRLVEGARAIAAHPTASLPQALGGWASLKGLYRFCVNKAVKASAILQSHVRASYERLKHTPIVLAVQDTCLLDFSAHPGTEGLGPLATKTSRGLFLHSTLAFTPERVPLGILAQATWVRDPETYGKKPDHKQRPIEEKESLRWLESVTRVSEARKACPNTRFVSIADREADIYDLFAMERPNDVDLLVRSAMDRRVEQPEKLLRARVAAAPVAARVTLQIPRREVTPKRISAPKKTVAPEKATHENVAAENMAAPEKATHEKMVTPQKVITPERTAILELRFTPIVLKPPRRRETETQENGEKLKNVRAWAISASEIDCPEGIKPIDWLLISTMPVKNVKQALEKLQWYTCRWEIEVWHKILKSGCRIEQRQLATAERLERLLTIYSIIAWRIQLLTMLGRSTPTAPCSVVLEESEWQALYCVIHKTTELPNEPPSLAEAVQWTAKLGGFLGRKGDGQPGITVIWRGFQSLTDYAEMYRIMKHQPPFRNVGNA